MTSKIIVDAHAGWPMRVTALDTFNGETTKTVLGDVAPGNKAEFHATDSRKLLVEELPREEQSEPADETETDGE